MKQKGFAPVLILLAVLVLFFCLFLLNKFVFLSGIVTSDLMQPNCQKTANYLAEKLTYTFSSPERSDVVLFRNSAQGFNYLARVIGLPGEAIELKNGRVLINGSELNEPYLPMGTKTGPGLNYLRGGIPFIVPATKYILMTDDFRNKSPDAIPPIERNLIFAKVISCKP